MQRHSGPYGDFVTDHKRGQKFTSGQIFAAFPQIVGEGAKRRNHCTTGMPLGHGMAIVRIQ